MKIVIYEVEDWERKFFERFSEKEAHDVFFVSEPLTEKNAGDHPDADIVSTFIYSKPSQFVLQQFNQLKLIATRSTGFDHIDVQYCNDRNIAVSNVPTYGQNTVAEHVFGLLLTISHKLDRAIDRTRRGDFSMKGLQGFDLWGKTLGVIGTGDIGKCVIRIANGFAMKVIAFDVQHDEEAAKTLGFEYVEFDELIQQSDIITLHAPGNKHTHHMISERQFDQMKDGAVLINTARGSLINMQALVRALAEGKLMAVGLDVLQEEPTIREEAELLRSVYQRTHNLENLLADHVVLRLRNVVVTPHSGFNTREAIQRILDTTIKNIEGFIEGQPVNRVNP